jgi:hypothetical protein
MKSILSQHLLARLGIFLISLSLLVLTTTAENMVEFDYLINQNGKVTLVNSRTFVGRAVEIPLSESEYEMTLQGKQKENLHKTPLPVFLAKFHPFEEIDEAPISIKVPYKNEYKTLQVAKSGEILLEENISFLCLEDGICQEKENYISCPKDCPAAGNDNICNPSFDHVCDADCLRGDPDCGPTPRGPSINQSAKTLDKISLFGGSLILTILLILILLMLRSEDLVRKTQLQQIIKYVLIAFLLTLLVPQIIKFF